MHCLINFSLVIALDLLNSNLVIDTPPKFLGPWAILFDLSVDINHSTLLVFKSSQEIIVDFIFGMKNLNVFVFQAFTGVIKEVSGVHD